MTENPNFTNFLYAVVGLVAVAAVAWLLWLIMFVGPNNNGERDKDRDIARTEACDQESDTAADVAVCVLALEDD